MKKIGYTAVILTLLAVAVILALPVLEDKNVVFAFNDGNIETVLSPTYELPNAFLRIWDNHFFFGSGSNGLPPSLIFLGEWVMGPHNMRREGVVLCILFTGIAAFWTLRQFKRSMWASFIGSTFFMLNGWNLTFPMNGLMSRSFALAFSILSIGMIEKGQKVDTIPRRLLAFAIAGAFLGLAVTEAPDVSILFALSCGCYLLISFWPTRNDFSITTIARRIGLCLTYVTVSLLIAFPTIGSLFATQVVGVSQGVDESPSARYEWATQWSLPKIETWSLVAPDFHGASSRSTKSPYWGRMGQSAEWKTSKQGFRNFRLGGYAIGVVPVIFLTLLLCFLINRKKPDILDNLTERKLWGFLAIAIASLMLSWGKYFPLYRLFYSLPYMGTIRNPDKWLGPFTLFTGLAFAFSIDVLIELRKRNQIDFNRQLLKCSAFAVVILPISAITGLIVNNLAKGHFLGKLKNNGFGDMASLIWQNAQNANIQLIAVFTLTCILILLYINKSRLSGNIWHHAGLSLLVLLMSFELVKAGMPFVEKHEYKHLLAINPLTRFLDENKNNGRIKLLPANHPLLNNWHLTMLTAHGYDLFDPVSVSRMPADYQTLFNALSQDPVKLWKMGAVRYFICTQDIASQLKKMSSPKGEFMERLSFGVAMDHNTYVPTTSVPPANQILKVLEFTGAAPFLKLSPSWTVMPDTAEGYDLALKTISGASFNPDFMTIIHDTVKSSGKGGVGSVNLVERTNTRVIADVRTEAPGLLVHAVKFDPNWKVCIDDQPTTLLRANYLFQGVFIPSGSHRIEFDFSPTISSLKISLAGRIALLVALCVHALLNSLDLRNTKRKQSNSKEKQ